MDEAAAFQPEPDTGNYWLLARTAVFHIMALMNSKGGENMLFSRAKGKSTNKDSTRHTTSREATQRKPMKAKEIKIYTVSEVNSLIKGVLEEKLPPMLSITGQISDWKRHQSGHCYFLLKDENAQLPCVMWSSNFRKIKFKPENGLAVIAGGFIDVYTVGGKYQFYVDSMQPAGLGALQLAFQQMAERLKKEGLFDEAHKKKIPPWLERIGILTSESGAALQDIAESIYSRWPAARLFLYPIPVQGEGAAEKIAAAIHDINRRNDKLKLDVLIVGRGGGSLEDLWAFNEEVLARAIYDSRIPIISAVGHEVDVTIADLVADARASTPTKAGVIAVPDVREVLSQLTNAVKGLQRNIQSRLRLAEQELETVLASALFRDPRGPVLNATQQVDETANRLQDSLKNMLAGARERLSAFYEQMVKIEPARLLGEKAVSLTNLRNRTRAAAENIINKLNLQLTAQENRLAGLNPKAVLVRGYSITTNRRTGGIVRKSADVAVGDMIVTELARENLIESEVKTKHNRKDNG